MAQTYGDRNNRMESEMKNERSQSRSSSDGSQSFQDSARDISSQVTGTVSQVKEGIKEGAQNLSETVRKKGGSAFNEVSNVASKAYDQISVTSRDSLRRIESEVRSNPITAVVAAFGLGAVCGLMCRRS